MARLYPELTRPVTLSKAEPSPDCRPLGTVQGAGSTPEEAYNALRRQAAKNGANYAVMDGVTADRMTKTLFGRAFLCPAATAPSQPPQAAPSSACVPDCSPGYTCVQGECVSACNPACEAGLRCGADRICHKVE